MPGASIQEMALSLDRAERAALADLLLESLQEPDPAVDRAWLAEAESRMAAFRNGEIEAFTTDEFFRGTDRS